MKFPFGPLHKSQALPQFEAGQIIELGSYPQSASGERQPIRWRILSIRKEKALLISEDCLIQSAYCDPRLLEHDYSYLEWIHSKARHVLNYEFYSEAFNNAEGSLLFTKRIDKNTGRPECFDVVFLLTEQEIRAFLPGEQDRVANASERVLAQLSGGAVKEGKRVAWWILPQYNEPLGVITTFSGREYRRGSIYPKAVWPNGEIQYHSRNVYHGDFTLRPSILIDLDRYAAYHAKHHPKPPVFHYGNSPADIAALQASQGGTGVGSHTVFHDVSMHTWRVTYQLDANRIWFLSVFIPESGAGELKFSLDKELAEDSHYEFKDEKRVRQKLYQPGDEDLRLHEIMIRYAGQHGADKLLSAVYPHITAQFHFD